MYKIILFCFGVLLIVAGRTLRIMHWPYAKAIYFFGLAICIAMIVMFVYGMIKKRESKYKIILFCLSILFISVGMIMRIMHWPYGKLIYFSGWVLCIAMIILFVYGMLKKKKQ